MLTTHLRRILPRLIPFGNREVVREFSIRYSNLIQLGSSKFPAVTHFNKVFEKVFSGDSQFLMPNPSSLSNLSQRLSLGATRFHWVLNLAGNRLRVTSTVRGRPGLELIVYRDKDLITRLGRTRITRKT